MYRHSAECEQAFGAAENARTQYVKQYPNYCRKCNGVGYVTWSENHGPFGMVWLEEMADACDCTGSLCCPGCKQPAFSLEDVENLDGSGKVYCYNCGWIDDEQHIMPAEHICWGMCEDREEQVV